MAYQIITPRTGPFNYEDACAISQQVERFRARSYVIHLELVQAASLAAIARLIALRGNVVRSGGQLAVAGLRGQTKSLYDVYGLHHVLPIADNGTIATEVPGKCLTLHRERR